MNCGDGDVQWVVTLLPTSTDWPLSHGPRFVFLPFKEELHAFSTLATTIWYWSWNLGSPGAVFAVNQSISGFNTP